MFDDTTTNDVATASVPFVAAPRSIGDVAKDIANMERIIARQEAKIASDKEVLVALKHEMRAVIGDA